MSSQDDSALIEVYDSLYVDNRCLIAVMALLVYEFLITFDQEVELFWVPKFTGASILFLSNRYLLLLGYILVMCEYIPMSDARYMLFTKPSRCAVMVKSQSVIHFLQYLPWAAFSGLRAFALLEQRWPLPTLIFILSLVPMGVNFAQYSYGLSGSHDPTFGCLVQVSLTVPQAQARMCALQYLLCHPTDLPEVTLASRVPLIIADALVIAVTWLTMHRRFFHEGEGMRGVMSLSTVLLRDGTIYFIVLLILNALHLTLTLVSFVIPFDPSSQVTTLTEPVTAVLVSRFLLDLQTANRKTMRLDSQDTIFATTSALGGTLDFARVVGSLGSSLHGPSELQTWRRDDDDEEGARDREDGMSESATAGTG
ncbi:hypothetical protein C8Q77DRAFT_1160216 [Trametes polyzona]|nr:hypothetical protein C8Q77DRAFT_1160216 [Trametes polyzona]